MAKRKSDTIERDRATDLEDGSEGVVLRDESDEIIDTLKRQLENLQGQLAAYRAPPGAPGAERPPPPGGGLGAKDPQLAAALEEGLTPHIASRLRLPAEELTARLSRLIERVDDPELRQELEHCRDTAHFLFETFQKISSNHARLTESLVAAKSQVEITEFCRLLEHVLPEQRTPVPLQMVSEVPRRIVFSSQSALAVVRTLAELVRTFSGENPRIEVSRAEEPPGPGPARDALVIRILSESPWAEGGHPGEVSTFAFRRGITAGPVVDLLYAEKIIELQGGRLGFYRSGEKVQGVEVWLPYQTVDEE